MEKKRAAICTLGCKVNQYESDAVCTMLKDAGYEIVSFDDYADVYIINTCTVTSLSDKKSRQMIRRAVKMNPLAVVAAMGCYVQMSYEEASKIEGVDVLIGNVGKNNIVELVEKCMAQKKTQSQDKQQAGKQVEQRAGQQAGQSGNEGLEQKFDNNIPQQYEYMNTVMSSERTRAFIKIQDGCNQFCSYCIIPYARGRIRSRDLEDVLAEVGSLAKQGFKEVVLTGIHIASYGKEPDGKGKYLIDVLEAVNEVDGIERVRLGSLEAGIVTDEFVERLARLDKFCPQFHLSLQSGSDSVLKRMNRKYTSEQYAQAAEKLRAAIPNATFTTDIIVGFPGESDEHFWETMDFAKKIGFMKIHVFPYSPRKGTVAAGYKDVVKSEVKKERADVLGELSDRMQTAHLETLIGKTVEVLVEQMISDEKITAEGHTRSFEKILIDGAGALSSGQTVRVKISSVETDCCRGVVVE